MATVLESLDEEDWNIDEEHGEHESDEHWELRRNFLLQNKGRFPRLRLLSLSQVFANMEFLGCRYPEETMDLVHSMSAGIIEEYRKARSGRLQRTFVKASDAAEKKSKGVKRHSNSAAPASYPFKSKVFVRESQGTFVSNGASGEDALEKALSQYGDDLRGFVLVDQLFLQGEGPLQTLHRSCGMSHKPIQMEYMTTPDGLIIICTIRIGERFVVEGRGYSKESARQEAATICLEKLRQLCYTIEVKANVVAATEFGKTDLKFHEVKGSEPLPEDNVGSKLLKLMGWQGGGLGKEEQGVQSPVTPDIVKRNRLGLGMSTNEVEFGKAVRSFLKLQMWQCAQFDLQFTPEFSTEERKIVHQIAGQLGLKSRSHGKGDFRFLVVSRKIKVQSLLEELLAIGESPKHRIVPPGILRNSPTVCNGSFPAVNYS